LTIYESKSFEWVSYSKSSKSKISQQKGTATTEKLFELI